jgi:hypothetical protein
VAAESNSAGSIEKIGLFDNERKALVLSLSPFRGSFFHQGPERFLLFLFPTVFAFAHDFYSLFNALLELVALNAVDSHPALVQRPMLSTIEQSRK